MPKLKNRLTSRVRNCWTTEARSEPQLKMLHRIVTLLLDFLMGSIKKLFLLSEDARSQCCFPEQTSTLIFVVAACPNIALMFKVRIILYANCIFDDMGNLHNFLLPTAEMM